MSGKETVRINGMGFLSMLGIVFITLKLLGVITWSWWWVLAPLWAPAASALVVFLFFAGVVFLIGLFD